MLEMNQKSQGSICDNLICGLVVTNWVHTGHENWSSCHKIVPDVTNLYPHEDRYKSHQWLWQCNQGGKWSFAELTDLTKGEGSHDKSPDDDVTKRKMTDVLSLQWKPSYQSLLCSYAYWLIYHKKLRGATNKLVQRSGTRWQVANCWYFWWIVV